MSRKLQCFVVSLSLVLCSPWLLADILSITDSYHPLTPVPGTSVVLLDQAEDLEAALSADLPSDPAEAQTLLQQRINPKLAAQISQAHQDIAAAWSLGVIKLPAVVVDQRYVVYGEPNVQKALDRIAEFRERRL